MVFRRRQLRPRSWKLLDKLNIRLLMKFLLEVIQGCGLVSKNWFRCLFRFGPGLNRLLFKKCNLKYNSWLILGSDLWLSGYKITIVASSSV